MTTPSEDFGTTPDAEKSMPTALKVILIILGSFIGSAVVILFLAAIGWALLGIVLTSSVVSNPFGLIG